MKPANPTFPHVAQSQSTTTACPLSPPNGIIKPMSVRTSAAALLDNTTIVVGNVTVTVLAILAALVALVVNLYRIQNRHDG